MHTSEKNGILTLRSVTIAVTSFSLGSKCNVSPRLPNSEASEHDSRDSHVNTARSGFVGFMDSFSPSGNTSELHRWLDV
ncbi:hypothetical protein LMH87_002023 [Akanthomyces muscarius]|uniref:Uncharacterized protein n=1 Tax=Akanthomyces muscarius TaxID=2231603 RepID=A0A9W8Q8S5_AKAMU|nr:hypothetical protein LMH87_002023 [Akanthomyces muscarius]KAJ4147511.1 hypothetical protein LMH87_002023 [Akanthomyces muscarius]